MSKPNKKVFDYTVSENLQMTCREKVCERPSAIHSMEVLYYYTVIGVDGWLVEGNLKSVRWSVLY